MDAMTVAVDVAKEVFEIAVSDRPGHVRSGKRLSRRQFARFVDMLDPATTVVMEAGRATHYWARRCAVRGVTVRLLPPQYVRPYVRRNKTDRADAEALLEADRCGAIHAVPVKTLEQQTIQSMHRVRQQWQRTRTGRINLLRGLLSEFGIDFPLGAAAFLRRIGPVLADQDAALPLALRTLATGVLDELRAIEARLAEMDRQLVELARTHPVARRLQTIPGVGVITATAFVGTVAHIHGFRRGRQFASWLGLTPRETSSGQRRVLGAISKQGNPYLRMLLVHGARAMLRAASSGRARRPGQLLTRFQNWAVTLAGQRGHNRATIAVANKLARIIWAVWTRDECFIARPIAA